MLLAAFSGVYGLQPGVVIGDDSVDFDSVLPGIVSVSQSADQDVHVPSYSFLYRYRHKLEERLEYEERVRQEELAARLAAAEERRLLDMRQRIASLSEAELAELYTQDYFDVRLRELSYYTRDYSNESVNYRNAIIRLQANTNMRTDAVMGPNTKKALIDNGPVLVHDEVSDPAASGYWITINKTLNILTVYEGSKVHKKYPVATGRRPSLTPEGKFKFVTKSVNPAWGGGGVAAPVAGGSPSNPLGYRWLGLSIGGGGQYGVHGNASANSIGTYASAGCIRMINADVESMYEFIPVGTPVWIGTDAKLAEFGIKQYYTLVDPPSEQAEPVEEEVVAEPEEAAAEERAIPLLFENEL